MWTRRALSTIPRTGLPRRSCLVMASFRATCAGVSTRGTMRPPLSEIVRDSRQKRGWSRNSRTIACARGSGVTYESCRQPQSIAELFRADQPTPELRRLVTVVEPRERLRLRHVGTRILKHGIVLRGMTAAHRFWREVLSERRMKAHASGLPSDQLHPQSTGATWAAFSHMSRTRHRPGHACVHLRLGTTCGDRDAPAGCPVAWLPSAQPWAGPRVGLTATASSARSTMRMRWASPATLQPNTPDAADAYLAQAG